MSKLLFALGVLFASVSVTASAQIQGEPIIVSGKCDPKSGVTVGNEEQSQFGCDVAVVARTDRGTIMIQFTDKAGDDGRILGFAGVIEGKQGFGADRTQMIEVQRLYLAGGSEPIPVSSGTCIMNWSGLQRTGGKLTSVLCGATGEAEGTVVKALAALSVR